MASSWHTHLFGLVLVLLNVALCSNSLSFYLTPGAKRCLKEEVHKQQMVVGQYSISDGDPPISILVSAAYADSHSSAVYGSSYHL